MSESSVRFVVLLVEYIANHVLYAPSSQPHCFSPLNRHMACSILGTLKHYHSASNVNDEREDIHSATVNRRSRSIDYGRDQLGARSSIARIYPILGDLPRSCKSRVLQERLRFIAGDSCIGIFRNGGDDRGDLSQPSPGGCEVVCENSALVDH